VSLAEYNKVQSKINSKIREARETQRMMAKAKRVKRKVPSGFFIQNEGYMKHQSVF